MQTTGKQKSRLARGSFFIRHSREGQSSLGGDGNSFSFEQQDPSAVEDDNKTQMDSRQFVLEFRE